MNRIRTALIRLAREVPSLQDTLGPVTKQADKWKTLPKGWDQSSVTKFWETLTGEDKHKVTKCIKQMDGKMDDPGAFCASLADKVDPGWRKRKAMRLEGLMVSSLPQVLKKVLAEVRVPPKRKINVRIDTSFSMYAAGDDGAKGFTAIVDIDTNQSSVTWGAFGGGSLGQKKPSPVDDVNTPKKPLPDHLVIVQGQIGGRDPYASLVCTDKTFIRLTGVGRRATRTANDASAFINTKTTALAKLAFGRIKNLKASFDPTPNVPSNVGGFIMYLFYGLGNRTAFQQINLLLGNMSGVGSGFGQHELESIARDFAHKVNEAEAAAMGILLLRSAKRPRAAAAFEHWTKTHLDLSKYDPSGSATEQQLRPGDVFEASITPEIQGHVAEVLKKVGKDPKVIDTLAYSIAENLNWHSLRSVSSHDGVDVDGDLVADLSYDLGGLDDVAAFIVAIFRAVGLKTKAEAVKKEALREFPDSYGILAGAIRRVASTWMRSGANKNPHIPKPVSTLVFAFFTRLEVLHKDMQQNANLIHTLWGDAEDALEAAKQAWVASGNHADDFGDPRLNPDGAMHEKAVRFCADFHHILDPKSGSSMTYLLRQMAGELEKMVKSQW